MEAFSSRTRRGKGQFKVKNLAESNNNSRFFDRRFDDHFKQHISEYAGDSEDDMVTVFQSIQLENDHCNFNYTNNHINDRHDNYNENKKFSRRIIDFDSLPVNSILHTLNSLSARTLLHQLTK